ncbi:MAG TPA: OmpA family protein [Steroidobacteraceae bacterium]|jgi:outer membrane protein OmpA-like peptidoglycan-associated protein|nr:OmpA family protein [Steroidobacteraceae bacterium]
MTNNELISARTASNRWLGAWAVILLGALAAGCVPLTPPDDSGHGAAPPNTGSGPAAAPAAPAAAATPPSPAAPTPPVPPPPPPVLSFDEAVANAAHAVFTNAPAPDAGASMVVIDPLVDGMTGYQSKATQSIQDRITGIVKRDFPKYAVQRITPDSLKQQPRVLVGTFTPVNAQMKTTGEREAYRFCLVMADLKTGKIVAKSVARARIEDADSTPTAAFVDSPVWTDDPSIQAYIATCQASKVGDPIRPEYFDGLLAASLVSEAQDAYDEGHYAEALDLFTTARKTPAGDQLRVYNGIYVTLLRLGRTEQSAAAFRDLVDYGLRKKRLAVKFLFRPGSVRFVTDNNMFSGSYGTWLQLIAAQAVSSQACLQITGHTSPTGPAAMNDSLSQLRAEYVQSRLEGDQPRLKKRTVATGAGSRENLIGTGRDDASDMLDRRVELKPIEPCS